MGLLYWCNALLLWLGLLWSARRSMLFEHCCIFKDPTVQRSIFCLSGVIKCLRVVSDFSFFVKIFFDYMCSKYRLRIVKDDPKKRKGFQSLLISFLGTLKQKWKFKGDEEIQREFEDWYLFKNHFQMENENVAIIWVNNIYTTDKKLCKKLSTS